ncbi:MAG: sigma-70 family RNA polymerase sigma factor [Nocardioides sp.]|uniref:sigma-70 family RNA polymerase sigma factor n=1 Tax=Nocardioides sp. TaxID=35761 RepID=UPI003D6A304D
MSRRANDVQRRLDALRAAVVDAVELLLNEGYEPAYAGVAGGSGPLAEPERRGSGGTHEIRPGSGNEPEDDTELAASSEESEADRTRLIALVELARKGDKEAFGLLFDHYHGAVYRFLFYRTRSTQVAEDLTSETFFRALRSMTGFRWQGKDFGAWLMTIARNLATDHFKAGRTRLEMTTEDMGQHDSSSDGPEKIVMAGITNEMLLASLAKLPEEQRDCIIMRFLQGLSIAETAAILGRSDGAVKQLQLRGIRNLAKQMPDGIR